MAKNTPRAVDDGWVRVVEVAASRGIQPQFVADALAEHVERDWDGRPIVPASIAREYIAAARRDEAERDAQEREAAARRERRREFVERRTVELADEAEKAIRASRDSYVWQGSFADVPHGGAVGLTRFAQSDIAEARANARERAEAEADKAGL